MNEQFFCMPQEKRLRIINAAYRVFALNGYRKAPMSEIAAEGGISKSLLFHYFHNKKELYLYLWEQSLKITAASLTEQRVDETDDLFEMLQRSLKGKCTLMRKYPYLSLFAANAYYERDPQVYPAVHISFGAMNEKSLEKVLSRVDPRSIREDLTVREVYDQMIYISDGYLMQKYMSNDLNADVIEKDFAKMILLWKKIYGRIVK